MPLDTRIALGFQPQQLDVGSAMQKGLSLRDMKMKTETADRSEQERIAMSDVMKRHSKIGADGRMTIDRGMALSELNGKVDQSKVMAFQKQLDEMDTDSLQRITQQAKQIAWSVTPDNYGQKRQEAIQLGLPNADKLPEYYSPQFVERWQIGTLDGEKQLNYRMDQEKLRSDALNRAETRSERRFLAGITKQEKEAAAAEKKAEKEQSLMTPYGLANTVDDAKQLKEAHVSKKSFDNKLEQLITLREKHGGGQYWNADDDTVAKQLSKDLLLEYKNLAKLGVLSQADEAIINAIIPSDPLKFRSLREVVQGQDATLAQMKNFKDDKAKDFEANVATRTRSGMKSLNAENEMTPVQIPKGAGALNMKDDELDALYRQLGGQ